MTMDDLPNPKPLDEQPYPKRKPPKKLSEVEPKIVPKIRFSFGDYCRIIWMVLLGEAEKKLNPQEKLLGETILCYGAIGLAALAILAFVLVRFFG